MNETRAAGGQPRLEELTTEECWAMLRSVPVGRLVWQGGEGLSVATVNFTVEGDEIVFRTVAYGAIAREVDDSPVAFHADHVDEASHTGWSVLVRGRAEFEHSAPPADVLDPWPGDRRPLPVRVTTRQVTGRRLALPR